MNGAPRFMMIRNWRSIRTATKSAARQPVKSKFEEGSEESRETSGPGKDSALARTQMVEFVLLQQPRVMERGFSIANRAVERTMSLHLTGTNAGSAFFIDTLLSLPLHFRCAALL